MKSINKTRLGFAMCGSFCTHASALTVLSTLAEEYDTVPILSFNASRMDTRFGSAEELIGEITEICKKAPVMTIEEAEKLGPQSPLDLMLICPCTGNTVAKLACGITDTPVTMAAKAHLRTSKPLLIALATNDALSGNIISIGTLMQRKNVYFVPMKQDDVSGKPYSLVCDFTKIPDSVNAMKNGSQLRPLFL